MSSIFSQCPAEAVLPWQRRGGQDTSASPSPPAFLPFHQPSQRAVQPLDSTHASPRNKLKFCRAGLSPWLDPHALHIPCTAGQSPGPVGRPCCGVQSTALVCSCALGCHRGLTQLPGPPTCDSHGAKLLLQTLR